MSFHELVLLNWTYPKSHLQVWKKVSTFNKPSPFVTARNEVGARLCFYMCVWFCSQGGVIPACIAGGIPACRAAGLRWGCLVSEGEGLLQGGAWSGGGGLLRGGDLLQWVPGPGEAAPGMVCLVLGGGSVLGGLLLEGACGDLPRSATASGGTHPTGMLSC